jgi:hypothetical protein
MSEDEKRFESTVNKEVEMTKTLCLRCKSKMNIIFNDV